MSDEKLLAAATEIQSAVELSKELYFVTFGIIISAGIADDRIRIKAKWYAPEVQETFVEISAEALADYSEPEWLHTMREAFQMLDSKVRQERFKIFRLRKIYG
jgi:hypothetical protein